ncbi:hydroxymethylglutaryl-CoA synthase family protein [Fictibacillus phosphorivorans]|uniref:hydroxymethylglutaryl-CoA synthase family protein n=1 Tax=Fictibacillus phosphorivorans TaxID=1221500 RepID=UPI003CF0117B
MAVGIEAINFYGGPTAIDVRSIFIHRNLDSNRFENLLINKKSVAIPCEDPVTYGVNAAKPILDSFSSDEKDQIQLIITATETGIDFGKSISSYIHDILDLNPNCRVFEIKQACYGSTAALQLASHFIDNQFNSDAKALIISTDLSRPPKEMDYFEASQSVGAIAMIVSKKPEILALDVGASGFYSNEIMDTFRPLPDMETGDSDKSLLSYLDCLEHSFKDYKKKVEDVDFKQTFDYLAFHTPFGGMVKGAHRKIMRQLYRMGISEIDTDFQKRLVPSLIYSYQVGNVYSATLYLALCSLIDHVPIESVKRIGLFSYGSGCSSEFFSGVITAQSKAKLENMKINKRLEDRYELSFKEYDHLIKLNAELKFGTKNMNIDISGYSEIFSQTFEGKGLLYLKKINQYHREYEWS